MTSFFSDSSSLPLERTYSTKQYPDTIRVVVKGLFQSYLPPELKTSSSEQSFKKYFGKKVKKLYLIRQDPSFNPAYRCKVLKTVKIGSLYKIRHPAPQIENLHVFDSLSWMPWADQLDPNLKKRLNEFKGISNLKYLKCFEMVSGFQSIHLKNLNTLRNLQTITLTIGEEQFAKNYRFLLSMKSLKRLDLSIVSIKIEELTENQSELPALSDFFIEVSKLGRLEFLAMRLSNIFDQIGQESRLRFLDCISQTEIPAFTIELIDTDECHIDCESLRPCMQNIDLFIVDIGNNASILIACGTGNSICQPIETARKKLKIFSNPKTTDSYANTQPVSVSKVLESGMSIISKDLCSDFISKLLNVFKDCLGDPLSVSEKPNIKHLKSYSLNMTSFPEVIDPLFLSTFENASNLEHLKLQRDAVNCRLKKDVYYYFSIISHTAAMQNLTSLHLIDFSVQESFATVFSEILGKIKNLKTLRLDLNFTGDKNEAQTKLYLPENSKLNDVCIKLPQLNGNIISDFIKFILSLNELEILTLHSGNQLIEKEKNRFILLEGFKRLKKLREVSLSRMVLNTPFMSSVRNNHKNPVVAQVQNELKDLFTLNSSLWRLCIESNEPPYQIRYKRY